MKLKFFVLFSIFYLLLNLNIKTYAAEPLVKYNLLYITNPTTGIKSDNYRVPDGSALGKEGMDGHSFRLPGQPITSVALNPNSPIIGYKDDCYPDDPNNPEGNIVISGKIISNLTNKPVNGAVVAVYMGAEQIKNIPDVPEGKENTVFQEKSVHGGKDANGKLTNLYYYDISRDGNYRVYACNSYKQLSEQRKDQLKKYSPNLFDNPSSICNVEGYSGNSRECTHFDFVKAYPKFSLAVICGMNNTSQSFSGPSPVIGEIYSIDNYNDDYKSANAPSYMTKNNYDIRVNCFDDITPFAVPMHLEYSSVDNIASCRMDDISPDLRNYFSKVQKPLKNDFKSLDYFTVPNSSVIPDETSLSDCTNPDDIFCLKNFITKSFPKPQKNVNVFDFGNKTYLTDDGVSAETKDHVLNYNKVVARKVDMQDDETAGPDIIPVSRNSTQGQLDAKVDLKTYIDDYKFDLNGLKDLYACFTTFNAPALRSNAYKDEIDRNRIQNLKVSGSAALQNEFYSNNLRIPSCRELYCGTEFVPNNKFCKIQKPYLYEKQAYGFELGDIRQEEFTFQLNALTGYGPGVTLNFKSLEEITNDLLVLSKELINSDFNPKKPSPDALYKPVTKVSDIVACLDDAGKPVYLNDGSDGKKEGSITYNLEGQVTTFFSPVPLMSYISVPYNLELFHALEGDNYANKKLSDPSTELLFPEQCNFVTPGTDGTYDETQNFANCKKGVIPGGVYSISALRVIANMCNNIMKIPTADAGTFTRVITSTQKNTNSPTSVSSINRSIDIELSATKIGTPLSVCLCQTNDPNCSRNTSINNKKVTRDVAFASIIGNADQTDTTNFIGFTCNLEWNNITKNPKGLSCKEKATNYYDPFNLPKNSESNFIGGNDNLKVVWDFSYQELASDEAHNFLTYSWEGREEPKAPYKTFVREETGGYRPDTIGQEDYNSEGNLKVTVPCRGAKLFDPNDPTRDLTDADPNDPNLRVKCDEPDDVPEKGFGLDRNPLNLSWEIINNIDDPANARIGYRDSSGVWRQGERSKINRSAGSDNNFVDGGATVVQQVKDGSNGVVYSRFKFRTAKYDPIPELLNDFRKFSIYGAIPGNGDEFCRTPKLGSLVDISASTLNTNADNLEREFENAIDNYTAGAHCNSIIPEEMDRCDVKDASGRFINIPDNWLLDASRQRIAPNIYCKKMRCLQFCQQNYKNQDDVVITYRDVKNPVDTQNLDFFCRNQNPTNGIEFQVNTGDEGCVLDYTKRIRQAYANPAEVDPEYTSVASDSRFFKESYPAYNNDLCFNPSLKNPSDPLYVFDKNNCLPFVGDKLEGYLEFSKESTIVPDR